MSQSADGHGSDAGGSRSATPPDGEDLRSQYAEILKTNDWIAQENQMLEDYLRRVYPNRDLSAITDKKQAKGKKGETKKDNFVPLSADEKSNICSHQLDAILQKIGEVERRGQDEVSEMKTMLEEVDVRLAETRRETHEFKRTVIVGAENPRTGCTMADKFVKYMEERLRAKDVTIEKLTLKNQQLKTQRAKLAQRVAQKEEMSETLHVVDFEQLKIENQQFLERVEAKNAELLQVKATTGHSVQTLNSIKLELSSLLAEQSKLEQEKKERLAQRESFAADLEQATHEKAHMAATVRRLTLEQQDSDQPKILDYIRVKHDNVELTAKKADAQRKADIAEMDERRTTRIFKSINAAGAPGQLTSR